MRFIIYVTMRYRQEAVYKNRERISNGQLDLPCSLSFGCCSSLTLSRFLYCSRRPTRLSATDRWHALPASHGAESRDLRLDIRSLETGVAKSPARCSLPCPWVVDCPVWCLRCLARRCRTPGSRYFLCAYLLPLVRNEKLVRKQPTGDRSG